MKSDDEANSGVSSIQVGFTRIVCPLQSRLVSLEENKSLFLHSVCFYYVQVLGARDVAVNKTFLRNSFIF